MQYRRCAVLQPPMVSLATVDYAIFVRLPERLCGMLEDLSSAALGAACARDGSNVTNATTSSEGNKATRQQFTIVCKRRTLASEVSAWHNSEKLQKLGIFAQYSESHWHELFMNKLEKETSPYTSDGWNRRHGQQRALHVSSVQ